jgi:hypothetical protein
MSGTAYLPTATSSSVLATETPIHCPQINRTAVEDPNTGDQYIVLCGRDYSTINGAGAKEITNFPTDSFINCIETCSSTFNCSAAGWGNYFGVNVCWLKSQIGAPDWSSSWQIAVHVGQLEVSQPETLNSGDKAGIAVGSVVGVLGISAFIGALWWTRRRRRQARRRTEADAEAEKERDRLSSPFARGHEVQGDMPKGSPYPKGELRSASTAGSGTIPPEYTGSREALAPARPDTLGRTDSNLQTPTSQNDTGRDWDWQGSQQRPLDSGAELPVRDGQRYGPEYELSTQDHGQHRPGPPWRGREAAEQKFLLQDLAFVKQRQKLNTDKADAEKAAFEAGKAAPGSSKGSSGATAEQTAHGEGSTEKPARAAEKPPDDPALLDEKDGKAMEEADTEKVTDDKRSERFELE